MSCPASGRVLDLSDLMVLKHPEALAEKIVSANKLSVTKFVCPEPGCGKSVDVYFRQDGKVRIRDHAVKGERVSMVGGTPRRIGRVVSLTSLSAMHKAHQEAFVRQMAELLEKAADTVKSADLQIEAQLALIKQSEERIATIKADKAQAEEILTSPEYEQYRKTA